MTTPQILGVYSYGGIELSFSSVVHCAPFRLLTELFDQVSMCVK